ncbi:hypothetical protein Hanom_Chr16g01422711 [Helianthus anomalus]
MVLDDSTPQNYVQVLKYNVQIPQTNKRTKEMGPAVLLRPGRRNTDGDDATFGGRHGWMVGDGPKPIPIPYSLISSS